MWKIINFLASICFFPVAIYSIFYEKYILLVCCLLFILILILDYRIHKTSKNFKEMNDRFTAMEKLQNYLKNKNSSV